ncbi:MAG TPA: hypothetical protein VMW16_12020 [Sedimentisphaerales bacterium]|nr:hypothetical protein [Sedimentisphaerales bacterium]
MKTDHSIRNVQITKVIVVLSGIILIVGGTIMVLMDIKSEGSITIRTPVLEGNIRATYIGLLVIFMGVVLELGAIMRRYPFTKKNKVIESPALKVREEEECGMCKPLNEKGGGG